MPGAPFLVLEGLSVSGSYTYDGFGNLTDQTTTKGSAPGLSTTYDPATNRQTGEAADANGNICSGWWSYGLSCPNAYTYDVENRIIYVGGSQSSPVVAAYSYAPGNKRVWRGVWSGFTQTVDEVTFWGSNGQKLTTYNLSIYATTQLVASATGSNYYFGGKLIKNTGGYVTPDRLGSIGKYFPYGQERPSATTDGKEKFATYFRDSETGLDYAQNRYHQPGMGRFMTTDRLIGDSSDPGTWNKYSYTAGDPVNRVDTTGNDFCAIDDLNGGAPLSDQCNGNTGACVPSNDPSNCLAEIIALEESGDCPGSVDAFAFYFGGVGPPATVPCGVPTENVQNQQPTCDQVLTQSVQGFLQRNDAALLSWDPTLAADLVAAGMLDGVDPRLMASIATLESGHGSTFGGKNNPFGLGPGWNFGTPSAAVSSEGITLKHLIGYGDTTVGKLYSGLPGIPNRRGGFVQVPGYCQSSIAGCQAAGTTVSGFLSSFAGFSSVGLTPGNPNKLGYPCP